MPGRRKSGPSRRRHEVLAKCAALLQEADPVGLIKAGAPPDEYDHEAHNLYEAVWDDMLHPQLHRDAAVEELENVLFGGFCVAFGRELAQGAESSFRQIALALVDFFPDVVDERALG